ncbi:MAG: hypothetical protein GX051_03570 [Clostridiales bacterium]|nr:hypothetical protein [Clostridiales bacterium]
MVLLRVAECTAVLCFLFAFKHSGHFFKAFFMTAVQGVAALFAVVLIGQFISVPLGINPLTLTAGILGGTPAVIMLLLINAVLCGG